MQFSDSPRTALAQGYRLNRGALFKNVEKVNDRDPDYRGNINVNGQEFWLNAWLNESAKGTKYLSLSIKLKTEQAKPAEKSGGPVRFGDPEIPF